MSDDAFALTDWAERIRALEAEIARLKAELKEAVGHLAEVLYSDESDDDAREFLSKYADLFPRAAGRECGT